MTDTQAQEAARLAEWHRDQALQWRRAAEFEAADNQEPTRSMLTRTADMHVDAAALLRSQAARIAELERELADLHTTMFAAAVEIQAHWGAHCDAEGYGPANLMHRLERGIASQYGYDAKTLQRVEAERDALRAELARMREPLSDEWIRARCKESWVFDTARKWVRAIEAAHGITKTGGGV